MSDILERIALCVERGKENLTSPYPPDLKDQQGARELTEQALADGISATEVLQQGLVAGMSTIGKRFPDTLIFIGRAPVTQAFNDKIQTDGCFPDLQSLVKHLNTLQ